MEHGFFHPDRGYWQTNSDVPQDILNGYPAGTVEIPLRPMGRFDWDGTEWVELPPDLEALAAEARAERNALLAAIRLDASPRRPCGPSCMGHLPAGAAGHHGAGWVP
jgi:hypothetical protein